MGDEKEAFYVVRKGDIVGLYKNSSDVQALLIQGLWKTKNQNMADLCKVAKELKDKFTWFEINHVEREWNSEADAQANLAVYLPEGEIQEDCQRK